MEKTGTGPGPVFVQPQTTPISGEESSGIPTGLDSIGTSQPEPHSKCCGGWLRQGPRILRLACKKWTCERCTRIKAKRIFARCKASPKYEQLNRLLTLPFKIGENRTWEQAIQESGPTLNRFLTSLRKLGISFEYFWVREIGKKSNMIHFHCLLNRYLPKKLLSSHWARAGGGYVVDIGIARKGMSYLWKYLLKIPSYPLDVQRALYGKRRYGTSRRLLALPVTGPTEWVGSHYICAHVGKMLFRTYLEIEHAIYTADAG